MRKERQNPRKVTGVKKGASYSPIGSNGWKMAETEVLRGGGGGGKEQKPLPAKNFRISVSMGNKSNACAKGHEAEKFLGGEKALAGQVVGWEWFICCGRYEGVDVGYRRLCTPMRMEAPLLGIERPNGQFSPERAQKSGKMFPDGDIKRAGSRRCYCSLKRSMIAPSRYASMEASWPQSSNSVYSTQAPASVSLTTILREFSTGIISSFRPW